MKNIKRKIEIILEMEKEALQVREYYLNKVKKESNEINHKDLQDANIKLSTIKEIKEILEIE